MKKKTLLLSITAVIMVTALAVGGTLAYFTSTDTAENTFTIGNVSIDLFEHEVESLQDTSGLSYWNYSIGEDEKKIETQSNRYNFLFPGATVPKDPAIRNNGTNAACVVLMGVEIPSSLYNPDSSWYEDNFSWAVINSDWVNYYSYDDGNGTTYAYYYYNGILKAGDETPTLFDNVNIPWWFTNEDLKDFNINMYAYAIQADGFYSPTTNTLTKSSTGSGLPAAIEALSKEMGLKLTTPTK